MAITLRGTTSGPNPFSATTTINLPTGTVAGDLTLIVGQYVGATVPNSVSITNTGWTTLVNCNGMFAIYREFVLGDPTSVVFTSTDGANVWQTAAVSYTGCDSATPIDTFNVFMEVFPSGLTAALRAPSVAPSFGADLLLACFVGNDTGGVPSTPAGFTSVIGIIGGPAILIASKQLAGAAQTGDAVSTMHNAASPKFGIQIGLHAAGDTPAAPAAPIITWGGMHVVSPFAASITVPLSMINAQQNDIVCVCMAASGETIATPAGWTAQGAAQDYYLFTRTFQSGDPNPTFTAAGSNDLTAVSFLLRATNGGVSTINVINTQVGSGTPSSATLPSVASVTARDYLVATWGQSSANGYTWTPSVGLTTQIQENNGPSILVQDLQPSPNPTGAFTAVSTGNPTIFAIELLVTPPAAAPTSVGGPITSLIW
jgi:hypothetical protein